MRGKREGIAGVTERPRVRTDGAPHLLRDPQHHGAIGDAGALQGVLERHLEPVDIRRGCAATRRGSGCTDCRRDVRVPCRCGCPGRCRLGCGGVPDFDECGGFGGGGAEGGGEHDGRVAVPCRLARDCAPRSGRDCRATSVATCAAAASKSRRAVPTNSVRDASRPGSHPARLPSGHASPSAVTASARAATGLLIPPTYRGTPPSWVRPFSISPGLFLWMTRRGTGSTVGGSC